STSRRTLGRRPRARERGDPHRARRAAARRTPLGVRRGLPRGARGGTDLVDGDAGAAGLEEEGHRACGGRGPAAATSAPGADPAQGTRPPRRRMPFGRAEPPPPNDTPPPETKEPPPVVVGLTLRSTTTAGSFDAPVGNTLVGKAPDKATNPANAAPLPVP